MLTVVNLSMESGDNEGMTVSVTGRRVMLRRKMTLSKRTKTMKQLLQS